MVLSICYFFYNIRLFALLTPIKVIALNLIYLIYCISSLLLFLIALSVVIAITIKAIAIVVALSRYRNSWKNLYYVCIMYIYAEQCTKEAMSRWKQLIQKMKRRELLNLYSKIVQLNSALKMVFHISCTNIFFAECTIAIKLVLANILSNSKNINGYM